MIGGFLVGVFNVASLASLTWFLMETYKNQMIEDSSRGFRTFMVGISYTAQLAFLGFLSTKGGAYKWFRGLDAPDRADTSYALGLVIGIFISAFALYRFTNRKGKNRS